MQTNVTLQDPYQYSMAPLILTIVFAIILGGYWIYQKRKTKSYIQEEVVKIPEKNIKNIPAIKRKHLKQLESIENQYEMQKIDLRKAYQCISEDIRMFIFEVTDITTQNYSLEEIKKINMPQLYELIKEYYEPEFASKSVGDFTNSIQKARGIINEWS